MFEFISEKIQPIWGLFNWICGNCVFLLSFWREWMGRGDFSHLRCSGPFSWRFVQLGRDYHCFCVCARGPGFRLRAQGPGPWASVGRAEGSVLVGPVHPVSGSRSSPLPLSVLPPPHPRAAPQLWASPLPPRRRQASAPFPGAGIFPDPPCVISFSRFSGWV